MEPPGPRALGGGPHAAAGASAKLPPPPLSHPATHPNSSRARKYGSRFHSGFLSFYSQGELSDVTVTGPDKKQYRLHMLLLAYHSEFFRKMFTLEFAESRSKQVDIQFEDTGNVWLDLLDYFYTEEICLTDDNVLPLLAMARELMVPRIQVYCADYAQNSLESGNAIQYLNQAVQFNCDAFRRSCINLVAQGFANNFHKPTDGLPVDVMLEILQHPELDVQTEEQMLTFVLGYVHRHALEEEVVRSLFGHVKLAFLSNNRLAALLEEEGVPRGMLLEAMAARLQALDKPDLLPSLSLVPRKTYVCSLEYGLPGGSEYVSIPIEAVWEELLTQIKVKVSGDMVEGLVESILHTHDDSSWFMVSSDSGAVQPVWIELEFPPHMRVVELSKYTFSHGMNFASHMFPYGISDSAWFQMKGMVTQVSPCDSPGLVTLRTQETCQMQLEYTVTVDAAAAAAAGGGGGGGGSKGQPWRRMRISTSQGQANATVRLSIRKLKLFGNVEVSLVQEPLGKDLLGVWKRRKESRVLQPGGLSRR